MSLARAWVSALPSIINALAPLSCLPRPAPAFRILQSASTSWSRTCSMLPLYCCHFMLCKATASILVQTGIAKCNYLSVTQTSELRPRHGASALTSRKTLNSNSY